LPANFCDLVWRFTLANSLSARKRARQAEKGRLRNASQRSHVRTAIKRTLAAIESGDKSAAEAAYKVAVPALDRSVAKGIMHRNKAARHKSRLNAHIKAL
jgi:small subunit ribosomal protein S20